MAATSPHCEFSFLAACARRDIVAAIPRKLPLQRGEINRRSGKAQRDDSNNGADFGQRKSLSKKLSSGRQTLDFTQHLVWFVLQFSGHYVFQNYYLVFTENACAGSNRCR